MRFFDERALLDRSLYLVLLRGFSLEGAFADAEKHR